MKPNVAPALTWPLCLWAAVNVAVRLEQICTENGFGVLLLRVKERKQVRRGTSSGFADCCPADCSEVAVDGGL